MGPKKSKKVAPAEGGKKGGKKGKGKVVPVAAPAPAPAPVAPPAPAPAPEPAPPPEPVGPPPLPKDPLEYARAVWSDPVREDVAVAKIRVVYSSYKTEFETRNGCVRWKDIDDEYAISFVFKGEFVKRLRAFPAGVNTNNATDVPLMREAAGALGKDDAGERDASLDELYWLDLKPDFDGKYTLEVEEDEAAGLGVETRDGPLVLADNPNGVDLPVGDAGARKEGCSCIYGNPCMDQYVCQNWAARFDIAKKNGWKGF